MNRRVFEMQPMECPDDLKCVRDHRGRVWKRQPSDIPGRGVWLNDEIGTRENWDQLIRIRGPVTEQLPNVVIPAARLSTQTLTKILERELLRTPSEPYLIAVALKAHLEGK